MTMRRSFSPAMPKTDALGSRLLRSEAHGRCIVPKKKPAKHKLAGFFIWQIADHLEVKVSESSLGWPTDS